MGDGTDLLVYCIAAYAGGQTLGFIVLGVWYWRGRGQ